MGKLFDESFCTSDYDQEMVVYISRNFGAVKLESEVPEGYLQYGNLLDMFWISDSHIHCKVLTKQQFKEKIGMIDKEDKKYEMVSYKIIDKEGFIKHCRGNIDILKEVGCDIFEGTINKDGSLVNEGIISTPLIFRDEFRFFEKIDNDTQAESVTDPVAQPDNELGMLRYQSLIDNCKELSINLVVTEEGLHILDCLNSVEYKIEVPDDYQKIVDALRLLQNKEMD